MGRASKFKKLAAKIEQEREAERTKDMTFNQRVAYRQKQQSKQIDPRERADIVIDGIRLEYESVRSPFHTYRYPLTYDAIPEQYKDMYHKAQKIAGNRFFDGQTLASQGVTMKPGIPRATFDLHLHLILASWDYGHEHKKALAAWLIDNCCNLPEELV